MNLAARKGSARGPYCGAAQSEKIASSNMVNVGAGILRQAEFIMAPSGPPERIDIFVFSLCGADSQHSWFGELETGI